MKLFAIDFSSGFIPHAARPLLGGIDQGHIYIAARNKTEAWRMLDARNIGVSKSDPAFHLDGGTNEGDALIIAGLLSEPAVYATPAMWRGRGSCHVVRIDKGGSGVLFGRLIQTGHFHVAFERVQTGG